MERRCGERHSPMGTRRRSDDIGWRKASTGCRGRLGDDAAVAAARRALADLTIAEKILAVELIDYWLEVEVAG